MTLAFIVFFFSFFAIAFLFALKSWEIRSGRVVFAAWRKKADVRALQLKELLEAARLDISKLPPEAVRLSRTLIHQLALGFAAFARGAEGHAHQVADLVSYKHHFEKSDTRSEFLKKVAEHKNGNGLSDESGGNNTTSQL